MAIWDFLNPAVTGLDKSSAMGAVSGPGFDWSKVIQPAVSIGGPILGNVLNNKINGNPSMAAVNENKRQFDIKQGNLASEQARRNAISGMVAPSMLYSLGYRDPAQIAAMAKQLGSSPQGPSLGNTAGGGSGLNMAPQASKASSTLGILGSGAGAAGSALTALGVGGMAGPIGLAAGGAMALGSMLANKIGAGRRTANTFVQGVENPFGQQDLAKVVQERDSGNVDQAIKDFTDAYQRYKSGVQQFQSAGGNQAKVAGQSLQNPQLRQTAEAIAQSLGIPFTWGS